jgi:hypothetical protein
MQLSGLPRLVLSFLHVIFKAEQASPKSWKYAHIFQRHLARLPLTKWCSARVSEPYEHSPILVRTRNILSISWLHWVHADVPICHTGHTTSLASKYLHIHLSSIQRSCFHNWALCYENVWGSGYIVPRCFDLATNWNWVVSFTPQPLCFRRKSSVSLRTPGWLGPSAVWGTSRSIERLFNILCYLHGCATGCGVI